MYPHTYQTNNPCLCNSLAYHSPHTPALYFPISVSNVATNYVRTHTHTLEWYISFTLPRYCDNSQQQCAVAWLGIMRRGMGAVFTNHTWYSYELRIDINYITINQKPTTIHHLISNPLCMLQDTLTWFPSIPGLSWPSCHPPIQPALGSILIKTRRNDKMRRGGWALGALMQTHCPQPLSVWYLCYLNGRPAAIRKNDR